MGYTTEFAGSIKLSRKLTFTEAHRLLAANETIDGARKLFGAGIPNGYFQWVPTESLDAIVWDGNEKFYDYDVWMRVLCQWLRTWGIIANGELHWQGEEMSDTGSLSVVNNTVQKIEGKRIPIPNVRPLTLDRLRELALVKVMEE